MIAAISNRCSGLLLAAMFVIIGAEPARPQSDPAHGFGNTVESAVQSSLKIKAASHDVKAADIGIWRQASGFLPTVSLGYGIGNGTISGGSVLPAPERSRAGTLTFSLPLLSGGQTFYGMRSAQSSALAARSDKRATASDVMLEATSAYLQYILAERAVRGINAMAERTNRLATAVLERREAGFASDADVAQIEAEIASLDQQRSDYLAQTRAARLQAESLAGRPVKFVSTLPMLEKYLPATVTAAADETVAYNQRIQSATHNAQAADFASRAAYGKLLPQLDVNGQMRRTYDPLPGARSNGWQVAAQLTVPIIDTGSWLEIQQRRESAAAVRLRADETTRQLQVQSSVLWSDYRGSHARLAFANRRLTALKKVLNTQEKLFEAGVVPLDTLLEKQRMTVTAEIERDRISMQRYLIMCQLLAAVDRFNLGLITQRVASIK